MRFLTEDEAKTLRDCNDGIPVYLTHWYEDPNDPDEDGHPGELWVNSIRFIPLKDTDE